MWIRSHTALLFSLYKLEPRTTSQQISRSANRRFLPAMPYNADMAFGANETQIEADDEVRG